MRILRPCAPRFDSSIAIYLKKTLHSQMVPTTGSRRNFFRGRQLEYQVLTSTGTISGVYNTLDTLSTASIPDVYTAGTAFTRGSVLLNWEVLAVVGPSVLLIQYCNTLSTRSAKYTRCSEYNYCYCYLYYCYHYYF